MAKAKNEAAAGAADEALPPADGTDAPAQLDVADTDAPAEPDAPRTVRARVLCQCDLGGPNDVIEVDPEFAKARADVLDTDASAVAYALSQRY